MTQARSESSDGKFHSSNRRSGCVLQSATVVPIEIMSSQRLTPYFYIDVKAIMIHVDQATYYHLPDKYVISYDKVPTILS